MSFVVISITVFFSALIRFSVSLALSLAACLAFAAFVSTEKEIVAMLGMTLILALPTTSIVDSLDSSAAKEMQVSMMKTVILITTKDIFLYIGILLKIVGNSSSYVVHE